MQILHIRKTHDAASPCAPLPTFPTLPSLEQLIQPSMRVRTLTLSQKQAALPPRPPRSKGEKTFTPKESYFPDL